MCRQTLRKWVSKYSEPTTHDVTGNMAFGVKQQRAQSMQTVQISLHISQFHHICTCKSNV